MTVRYHVHESMCLISLNGTKILQIIQIAIFYQGDSGGPFTIKENDQHVLIGVTSWGQGPGWAGLTCGESSVFARISHLRLWIEENLKDAKFCPYGGDADNEV